MEETHFRPEISRKLLFFFENNVYNLSINDSMFKNCTFRVDKVSALFGTMLEGVFLGIVLTMMGFFSVKTRFTPSSNIWLFAGCVAIALWLMTKMAQDYAPGPLKCIVTENLALFCSLLGGALNVGMCVDRCRAVYSRMARGSMTPAAICTYIFWAVVGSLLVIAVNALEMSRNGLHMSEGLEGGCFQAASPLAHRAKLVAKFLMYLVFVCIVSVGTALTLVKILNTNLNRKRAICVNVVLVTLPNTFIWLTAMTSAWREFSSYKMCPKIVTGNVFIYLSSVPMLVILFVYMFTGKNLKHTLRPQTRSYSSSTGSASCFAHLAGKP
ncbi:membrane protein BILF1 [Equid gammaherpesvirus 2]|nr:membrane protein BILF1 [Equid gammaherpesvirus 2]